MVERSENTPRHMPLTLLSGDYVERNLQEKKRIFLPKGSKALLTLGLESKFFRTDVELLSIGPTVLHRDFEGVIDTRKDTVKDVVHYPGMPKNSIRVRLIPDSELRKEKVGELDEVIELLKPYNLHINRKGRGKLTPIQETLFRKASEKKNRYHEELREIDRQLKADFLEDRQEELDIFFIDRHDVKSIRLDVAVDRNIQIPKVQF
jgi:hypothetical protein